MQLHYDPKNLILGLFFQYNGFIKAYWPIYASVNKAIIDSDNSLSPVRCQVIIWAKWLVSIETLGMI